jgi:hypothetical protein
MNWTFPLIAAETAKVLEDCADAFEAPLAGQNGGLLSEIYRPCRGGKPPTG